MRRKCEEGCIPIVLISSYRFDHEKQPHWVVVTGFDAELRLPARSQCRRRSRQDRDGLHANPCLQGEFVKMARYGKAQQQAALVIGKDRG